MWPFRKKRERKIRRILRNLVVGVVIGSAIGSVVGKRLLDERNGSGESEDGDD